MINNDAKLTEIVEKIVAVIQPAKIYLFGSRARGNESEDADYDILIISRGRAGASQIRRRLLSRIRRELWDIDSPLDILIYTEGEFAEWRSYDNHPLGRAAREGKVIYEAA